MIGLILYERFHCIMFSLTGVTTVPSETTAPTTEPPTKGLDLAILIDSSFGVTPEQFKKLKTFVAELVASIRTHFKPVQLGFIVYSEEPELVMTLKPLLDNVDVSPIIQGIKYLPGGHRTDLAMMQAKLDLFCPEGCRNRPENENVMIVFTSENTDPESMPYDSVLSPAIKVNGDYDMIRYDTIR